MDFTDARNVLLLHKKWGRKDQYRIGIMKKDAEGLCCHHKGDVVLYEKYEDRPHLCTVHMPMNKELLAPAVAQGFGITTIKTMVCVPVEYMIDAHENVKLKGERKSCHAK